MLIIKEKTLYIYSTLKDGSFFVNNKILTMEYVLYNIKQQNNQNKYSTKIENYEKIFNY